MSTSLNSTTAFGLIDRFARYARRFVLLGLVLSPSMVMAQEAQIIQPGSMTVTGFSGTVIPGIEEGLPPGVSPIDETLIDLEGKTLRIFDVTNLGGPASGQVVNTPLPFEVPARQIGQVFGIAYDDGVRTDTTEIVPNVYVGATSLHGLQIVSPDEDEDGRPERQRRGTENAVFMDGQFGLDLGGGPGSVYKIDGLTGQVSKFADIEGNSGPGLGNLKFDKAHRQFFVSDLDTGLIHRISADGALIDTFDHGVAGRPVRSLEPVSDDGSVMDIKGGTFDTEDPETWGYTQDERRVWGVAVHGGRLYYAVGDEAEIWSVDILEDGAFGTARWELTVKAEKDYPVTDIAFDNRGFMYLSQRGEIENRYDYSRFANSGKGEVIRYWRESPDDPATESIWVESPQEYAVGFPPENRQAAGGLDLQYDYDANGFINPSGSCTGTLVKTGDDLRNNPELESQLAAGGPLVVHGVQLTPIELVKPNNVPPFGSWFVDFDNLFEDPDVKGHVGDVEVWRPCAGRAAWYDPIPYPGDYPDPYYPPYFPPGKNPCIDIRSVEYFCTPAGLEADIYITDTAGFGGDSLKTDSLSPGVSVTPPMQTVPNLSTPFTYNITGHVPGDKVRLGLCFYKDADAKKGGYFPCCKVNADIQTPAVSCEP